MNHLRASNYDLIQSKLLGSFSTIEDGGEIKRCRAGCEGHSYQVTASSSVFPVPNTFSLSPLFCHVVRKLSRACKHHTKATLEVAYPNVCKEVNKVLSNNSCENKFNPDIVSKPFNAQDFEALILRYAKENIVVISVYIKDPFATKIMIDENSSK